MAQRKSTRIYNKRECEKFLMDFSQPYECEGNIELAFSALSAQSNQSEYEEASTSKLHLPLKSKQILENWMYEHRFYCYPTKTEKQMLSIETGLNVQRISNWFINSRRRLLPKMLEREGRDSIDFTITRKKKKDRLSSNRVFDNSMDSQRDSENIIWERSESSATSMANELPIVDAHRSNPIIRGILYDENTKFKCLFILTD